MKVNQEREYNMRLNINHFSKIEHADILVDGITVIAGNNNTGKSTIGKILFSLFYSVADLEEKVEEQRLMEIRRVCNQMMPYFLSEEVWQSRSSAQKNIWAREVSNKIVQNISEKREFETSDIRSVLAEILYVMGVRIENRNQKEALEELVKRILDILKVSDDTIQEEIISRLFRNIFHGQVNSLLEKDEDAEIILDIKDKKIKLDFRENKCKKIEKNIVLMNKAIYIDNPFIVDKLSDANFLDELSEMDELLRTLMVKKSIKDNVNDVIKSVLVEEKLTEINKMMRKVINGNIIEEWDEFYLEEEGCDEPVHFGNLSTGLKAFVVLKMLIERGAIKEKDVLILDEPEIHLHPQWQIAYAELIVLLQKYFNLSIVITTHSPYFLDAVNLFSIKYGISQKVNYYLSALENNYVTMESVTNNIDKIYAKMASPIQVLDTLRHELNNQ